MTTFRIRIGAVAWKPEPRLLAAKALTALRQANPKNGDAARQIKAARAEITEALRRTA